MAALMAALVLIKPFKSAQMGYQDILFVHSKTINNNIKIIGIDDKSLQKMGNFSDWSRKEYADLLSSFDEENLPAVVAFDINFFGERDANGDEIFVKEAEKNGRVVTASYINFNRLTQLEDGGYTIRDLNVQQIELPFSKLNNVSRHGFTNTVQDSDNYIRKSILSVKKDGETEYNFAYEIYSDYMKKTGQDPIEPKTDKNGTYGFDYAADAGNYEIYSFSDVVNGECDPKIFKDSIVLVGAYAAGMMDQYMVPISKNSVMNGVEVQANHVNALLDGRVYVGMDKNIQLMLACCIIFLFMFLCLKLHMAGVVISGCSVVVSVNAGAYILYLNGIYCETFYITILTIVIMLVRLAYEYISEKIKKNKILKVFKRYVAPQVVDEIGRIKDFNTELGGTFRDVAVLFIDIRGFTSLSEKTDPKMVVEILNKYLGLVTNAVFKYDGMIDKFIGDAVMAVYNAPVDIENYHEKAVLTGIEIFNCLEKLNDEFNDTYGFKIKCGIGIHCGQAVIGNIGCDYRMDYTAIGDTVNVSERLESIAKGGEILISSDMYDKVKNSFKCEFLEEVNLKGRKDKMSVYRVEAENGSENDR